MSTATKKFIEGSKDARKKMGEWIGSKKRCRMWVAWFFLRNEEVGYDWYDVFRKTEGV
ncbi:MAG: hypothetical protein FWF19_06460 [Euryarchaeota archaeon]|nr:hypothetical protein [Euryarchaeota archaeon]